MGCLLKQGGGLYPRLRIGAVLLAAGEGRRMGGVPKPLIRLQGVPLISRQMVALSGAGVDEVVVVTGHARHAIEEQVRSFVVTLVHNAAHADGQQGSVRVGLAALMCPHAHISSLPPEGTEASLGGDPAGGPGGNFDAVIIMPADLPLIGASDLTELIGAFKKRPAGHVVVPVVDGQRGNPIILDDVALTRILASDTNLACRHLIERQPELVYAYETANTRFVTDLDTVEDVRQLAQRTGWRLELPTLEVIP
jgi:CTP:molybdopterin cytidylyltransferase MocA